MENSVELEELASCIVEFLSHDFQSEKDPFDQYAHQLRARLQRDNKTFCAHFIQGYAVLLEQLQIGL